VAGSCRPPRARAPERWALEYFAGSPYEWGGVTPCGVDCSGMVQTTFLARGLTLPRDSSQQATCGAPVPLDDIRPGDLLFFRDDAGTRVTHVAFAGEADTLVHSTVALGGMVQEPWLPGSRAASLRERLVAVRRLEER
jgi:gamma-D-glutamyl-L-lysine dipeptidyl-peptidase